MFDNLRDDAASSPFYEEDTLFPEEEVSPVVPSRRKKNSKLLGMTPVQRFVLAMMLMLTVCTLGAMCLLLTGRIGLL